MQNVVAENNLIHNSSAINYLPTYRISNPLSKTCKHEEAKSNPGQKLTMVLSKPNWAGLAGISLQADVGSSLPSCSALFIAWSRSSQRQPFHSSSPASMHESWLACQPRDARSPHCTPNAYIAPGIGKSSQGRAGWASIFLDFYRSVVLALTQCARRTRLSLVSSSQLDCLGPSRQRI